MKKFSTNLVYMILFGVIVSFLPLHVIAQESYQNESYESNDPPENYEDEFEICGSEFINEESNWAKTYQQMLKDSKNNSSTRAANIIYIPVVMHIVHNGEPIGTGRNISNAQIQSFLDVLNEDFRKQNASIASIIPPFVSFAADVQVEFCLASQHPNGGPTSGINRYFYAQPSWGYEIENVVKVNTVWNSVNYMNVWVADISNITPIAYAKYPGGNPLTDGIVMDYRVTGRFPQNPYNNYYNGRFSLGHVGSHEVGHWLGLQHTFDNGCGSPLLCNSTGDNICDTPAKSSPTWGCNLYVYQCLNNALTMVQNFMDYADDQCKALFTHGQKAVMQNVLNGIRSGILTSPGCQAPCNPPGGLAAINITNTTATLTWGAMVQATSYNIQYRKFAGGPFPWINGTSNNNLLNINNLTAFTPYEFRVQSVCNGATSAWSQPVLFWTLTNQYNCGNDPWENAIFYPPMQNNVPTYGLICPLGDVDFQLIQVQIPNSTITVTLDQLPADYDLELRDAAGTLLAGSYNAGVIPEVVNYANAQPGYYYPNIMSNVGQWNPGLYFRLTAVVTPPPPLIAPSSESRALEYFTTDLKIYPNPAQDRVILTFNNMGNEERLQIGVMNLLGQSVRTFDRNINPGFNQIEIDISDLENGSYFLQSTSGSILREGTKLIIQH